MTEAKILSLPALILLRKQWAANKQQVVFTNGCFDILHLGHVDYLEKARQKGQKLIVGLNSDASVKRLKGDTRPINEVYARARMLAALAFVDAVVVFEHDTPLELIQNLLPDVLVKGNDYSPENIVGAKEVIAAGGSVETISLVDGYSTTNLVKKMSH
ncbi:MAG: D-glycero-beta-D-manno-heptose 1-phosphate adenylyltransferase [Cytophagales bacterium]|nr:MAG: D-glycero-beta-D-manno-heptose 1-phosphate adenylyltransferase [Cytophagales bacterium]TAF59872.1 MAG: D-glycero-beta-D-manno-heptose 1-phosphate adenylyltransferase [Cytophagales bacterium]